ncbi:MULTISPECIES: ABC transporter permease [unclassified Agarivorans]|uniref:ABC transporter permease n=1 Tax=unclassified Agarivorans TaxID=2636026 RepID=UPI0010EABCEA|nr:MULTISPECIES: ABC transporter permease subunit [unclassified Agarivorans]MDO6684999.1 ABC transporter permease subunit [Agarivorans sp. 3_MG-2023]MDO6717443.1 ABC transporter permease subunit [Agarivorans sp. 2_MG-2023]MDO6765355.1 ABC transporter permease subunit [Agarivorans sp. 1_MG-2023]GDY27639.1 ABC transporter permease [Agarivorans sp. Toyoura001]
MTRLINKKPSRITRLLLGLLPFIVLIVLYMMASQARLVDNPNDKLLPAMSSFVDAINRMAFEPSRRSGEYLMLADTLASLSRLAMGVGISALIALIVGVANGMVPFVRAPLSPLVTALSLVPPMAILPILFIVFGLGELSKVMLIIIGICPIMIRDLQLRTDALPPEQILKAQTLGASSWQTIIAIVVPQILPKLIEAVRLTLGSAWLFLIAAEAIAATEGLGYRIFLIRRYLAMDVILPYVLWISLLAFVMDWLLRKLSQHAFTWYHTAQGDA